VERNFLAWTRVQIKTVGSLANSDALLAPNTALQYPPLFQACPVRTGLLFGREHKSVVHTVVDRPLALFSFVLFLYCHNLPAAMVAAVVSPSVGGRVHSGFGFRHRGY
jgi:hypothetical protein